MTVKITNYPSPEGHGDGVIFPSGMKITIHPQPEKIAREHQTPFCGLHPTGTHAPCASCAAARKSFENSIVRSVNGIAAGRLSSKQYNALIAGSVRGALAETGYTQVWLAEHSGLKLSTLKRKLAGQRSFNMGELFVVSVALGIDMVSFIPASRYCDAHGDGSSTPCGACGRARRMCAAHRSKAVA